MSWRWTDLSLNCCCVLLDVKRTVILWFSFWKKKMHRWFHFFLLSIGIPGIASPTGDARSSVRIGVRIFFSYDFTIYFGVLSEFDSKSVGIGSDWFDVGRRRIRKIAFVVNSDMYDSSDDKIDWPVGNKKSNVKRGKKCSFKPVKHYMDSRKMLFKMTLNLSYITFR